MKENSSIASGNLDQPEKTYLRCQLEKEHLIDQFMKPNLTLLYPMNIKLPTGDGAPDSLRCVFSS